MYNLKNEEIKTYEIVDGVNFYYPSTKAKIAVKMSGGLDSATMLYTLATLQKSGELHPETVLQPVTGINWPRPYQEKFVNQTIDYVNKKLAVNIPYTLPVYGGPDDDIGDVLNKELHNMIEDGLFDFSYIGETKFLPKGFIDGTKWEHAITKSEYFGNTLPFSVILDVTNPENTGYHYEDLYDRIWSPDSDEVSDDMITRTSLAPWKNYHKGHIKQVSDYFGISDDLLAITRSCEYSYIHDTHTQMMEWDEHCEECMWCVERMVTYGRCQ